MKTDAATKRQLVSVNVFLALLSGAIGACGVLLFLYVEGWIAYIFFGWGRPGVFDPYFFWSRLFARNIAPGFILGIASYASIFAVRNKDCRTARTINLSIGGITGILMLGLISIQLWKAFSIVDLSSIPVTNLWKLNFAFREIIHTPSLLWAFLLIILGLFVKCKDL
jgi:hypothetical protein